MVDSADPGNAQANNRMSRHPVVFIWGNVSKLDRNWIEDLGRKTQAPALAAAGADTPDGLERLDGDCHDLPALAAELVRRFPGSGALLLRAGLVVPERAGRRMAELLDLRDAPAIWAFPGNHDERVDPLAGLEWPAHPGGLDSLAALCGERRWHMLADPPLDCLLLGHSALESLAGGNPAGDAALVDDWYVIDPLNRPGRLQSGAQGIHPGLGQLRQRLLELADRGIAQLPPVALDGRPVTLHISHDWGGGIERWIADISDGDAAGHHLVLVSCSGKSGPEHGQWLELRIPGKDKACIRRYPLAPAISSTASTHQEYRDILAGVCARFGVGRIMVSSLIGHSLDALLTDLPTAQVLHDYYPAWPFLDRDPLPFTRPGGPPDIARALHDFDEESLFAERRDGFWLDLAARWRESIRAGRVALFAPTRHVAARWQRLVPEDPPDIEVIPHGFRGWADGIERVPARPAIQPPLRLVIVGRLGEGKGIRLLENAMPRLRRNARITVLGCGASGHRLFGTGGVDLVLDYAREEMPGLLFELCPDAALFLSTVPETWNYVLSETRSLGLVPVATHLGSFAERIRHGVDGILIDPNPDALVAAVEALAAEPGQLERMRAELPAEPGIDRMAEAYGNRVPPRSAPRPPHRAGNLETAESGRLAALAADRKIELDRLQLRLEKMAGELERRARWAETMEREFRKRSAWAAELEAEVARQREIFADTRAELEAEVARQREIFADTRAELDDTITELHAVQSELHTVQSELHAVQSELRIAADALAHTHQRIGELESEREIILASRSWRLTRPLRVAARILRNAKDAGAFNPLNWPRHAGRLIQHLTGRGPRRTLELLHAPHQPEQSAETAIPEPVPAPQAEARAPVVFTRPAEPVASVIVPVFNQLDYTAACLDSLARAECNVTFEVIVVDDASSDETGTFLDACDGIEVVRNPENRGFVESCNRGADAAHGGFLVFLNNDTTVTDGWLDALIGTFDTFPSTGIAGARLIYPDGLLQEAGGIVFGDGSGWNFGRGEHPARPEYRFASEADYVSGACLAIPRELFAQLGGFDEEFMPAYYEDTDLCFRVRARGLKVICQPACSVYHHEGASSGTDERAGVKRYQAVNRERFRERWHAQLADHPAAPPARDDAAAIRRARFHRYARRALVIDAVTPTPDQDSGSMRMRALLDILRDDGFLVSFMPANLSWVSRYSSELQQAGIELLWSPWVRDPEEWLARNGADLDLVLVSRHYVLAPLLNAIRRHCPQARLILDTVDLHFLREEREAEVTGSERIRKNAAASRKQELALIVAADCALVVSPVERQLLNSLVPAAEVRVLSNIHEVKGRRRGWSERADLMFIGGFQHKPNVDAARWLIDEIFPRVRERLPEAGLHLIGSRMPPELRRTEAPGIHIHGYVPDAEHFFDHSRVSVAPIRYGAGVKGKVNQAMSYGLPVVATACAAEGMHLTDGEDVLIADDAADFAEAVVKLYTDEALWTRLSDYGLENIENHFSRRAALEAVNSVLEYLDMAGSSASDAG